MKRGMIGLVALVVLIVSLLYAYAYYRIGKVVHVRIPSDTSESPKDYGLEYSDVEIDSNGLKLAGWYFPVDETRGGVVLIHGYGRPGGGKANMLAHAKYMHDAGWTTLAIDLRSFGDSKGTKISFGGKEWMDVRAADEFLRSKEELRGKPVGLMGVSMGGAAAIIASGKERVGDFVVSSGAYASLESLFRQQSKLEGFDPRLFLPPIMTALQMHIPDQLQPIDYIDQIEVPVLILHGKEDEDSAYVDALELLEAGGDNVRLISMDTKHDIHKEAAEEFEKSVIVFLNSIIDGNEV